MILPTVLWGSLLLSQYVARGSNILSHITREKCYDELGCFSANAPFFNIPERPISLLPEDREKINTTFSLYTPANPKVPTHFSYVLGNTADIGRSTFNPRARTKFVVPGYISNSAPEWKEPMVEALLSDGGNNVFVIDWSGGDGPVYEQAVANTRVVGAEMALLITRLQEMVGISQESVHIIGHSLGSHIAGYAGKRLESLGRITGMDPAGPYFTKVDPVVRLDRGDALLVDVIHTNAAATVLQGFGLNQSIGHFDFYPNGGHLQPGCKDMGHAILSFLKHPSFDAEGLHDIQCNHLRAIYLFISSIKNSSCELKGVICDSFKKASSGGCGNCNDPENHRSLCVSLGIHVDRYASLMKKDTSLNLYLNTTADEPYCLLQ